MEITLLLSCKLAPIYQTHRPGNLLRICTGPSGVCLLMGTHRESNLHSSFAVIFKHLAGLRVCVRVVEVEARECSLKWHLYSFFCEMVATISNVGNEYRWASLLAVNRAYTNPGTAKIRV